jgi:methionyl-tRNA formyltransferase
MKITILTDNPNSWILPYIEILKDELKSHELHHIYKTSEIIGGDIMFILSCESILKNNILSLHKNNIVIHPSKVPHGKGWSPLAWQILEGKNKIPVSLFEAVEKVDAGNVYLVDYIELVGTELNDEIKHQQGLVTIRLVLKFINEYDFLNGIPQFGEETFYKKRGINANQININKTISEQFNLLRIVDNERYPAYFIIHGKKYIVKIYNSDTLDIVK